MVDMGVEPYLVCSTVEGVMAQRLVRVLCRDCRQPYTPRADELPEDFLAESNGQLDDDLVLYRAVGCRRCRGTGFSGRVGIFELLETNDEVRKLASERAPTNFVKQAAIRAGMRTLRQDGWRKVLRGITSIEEVLRVTKVD